MPGYKIIEQLLVTTADRDRGQKKLYTDYPCRYCGQSDTNQFKNKSHALPESLGNNFLISGDECDECNTDFGRIEDELVKFYGNLRTILGTPNKNARPKSKLGSRRLSRNDNQISLRTGHMSDVSLTRDPDGSTRLVSQLPKCKYRPYDAFLAIQKCAVSMLDRSHLPRFSSIIEIMRFRQQIPEHLAELTLAFNSGGTNLFGAILFERDDEDILEANLRAPKNVFALLVGHTSLTFAVLDNSILENQRNRCRLTIQIQLPQVDLVYAGNQYLNWSTNDRVESPFNEFSVRL